MNWLKKFIRRYRVDLWILEGVDPKSKTPLSILCSANDWDRSYLAKITLEDDYREYYVGRSWLWNIRRTAQKAKQEPSMIIVSVKNSRRKFLETGNWFYIPVWIDGTTDLPLKPEIKKKETLKSDLRKIKKSAFEFEVSRDRQQLDDFYHNMFTPFIRKVHGDCAYILPYEKMKKHYEEDKGELLLIKKGNEYIAGMLILYTKNKPLFKSLGIRDGNLEYVKNGIIGALYHFSLQYLEKKNFSTVSYGLSRGFLRDGVLQYKKKWGHRVDITSGNTFALRVLSYTEATKYFLENNPFIIEDKGSLDGIVFLNEENIDSPQKLEQLTKVYAYPGLSRLFYYVSETNMKKLQNSLPEKWSTQIIFKSTEKFIKRAK
ncbi:MAG: hypothetical protein ABXS91_05110 [Sulfurimonas sp.]